MDATQQHNHEEFESIKNILSTLREDMNNKTVEIAKNVFEINKHHFGALFLHNEDPAKQCIAHVDVKFKVAEDGSLELYCDNELDDQLILLQCIGTASVKTELIQRVFEVAGVSMSTTDNNGNEQPWNINPDDFWFNPSFNHVNFSVIVQQHIQKDMQEYINEDINKLQTERD